jgi:NAD(P)H-dependent flavin oxidoreductase YrpB (nitropropane dioxygenase family)
VNSFLGRLQLRTPVLVAPMAGGPSTPNFVRAAADAGSLGFLAAGYKTPQLLAEQIQTVRATTPIFGVNLFAPNPVPVVPAEFRHYAESLQPEAERYGLDLAAHTPVEDDDHWHEKVDLLRRDPVPVVSFTFGVPDPSTVAALRRAGTITIQTVTALDEAMLAVTAGVDVLAVQAVLAGGHFGTLTPQHPATALPLSELVATIRAATGLPVIAAGGLSTPAEVAGVLGAGADAVMVGTVLLRSVESGASAVHQAAIADPARGDTVVTRAFTGRPARALPNAFIAAHNRTAPLGYPAIHHLTGDLRRAATAAGDPERVNLWAGAGYRNATAEPLAVILDRLAQTS